MFPTFSIEEVWASTAINDNCYIAPALPLPLRYDPMAGSGFETRALSHPVTSRSFHDVACLVERLRPRLRVAKPASPDRLYGGDFRQCPAIVFRAAAIHQDGAAAARRLARGVVGGNGVLPVAAARRLCLCAFPDAAEKPRH